MAQTEISKILNLIVHSKSLEWKEENEWRLVWNTDETRAKIHKLPLLDGSITAIYFGCRVDDRVKEDLIFETKRNFPNAKIYKGKPVPGKLALEFEEIF